MPSSDLAFGIAGWFAWQPGLETPADWRRWAGIDGNSSRLDEESNLISLPMMLRRRMTAFGQKVVTAALATEAAGQARYIFASRHGEFPTTLRILENLSAQEMPSPSDFSMSVHHALAGLLSIHAANKAGHTLISAGADTMGYGLLEAVTTLNEDRSSSVLLVTYDEPLAGAYRTFSDDYDGQLPMIMALNIVAPEAAAAGRFTLSTVPKAEVSGSVAGAKMPMAQEFLRFFLSPEPYLMVAGETITWNLRRAD